MFLLVNPIKLWKSLLPNKHKPPPLPPPTSSLKLKIGIPSERASRVCDRQRGPISSVVPKKFLPATILKLKTPIRTGALAFGLCGSNKTPSQGKSLASDTVYNMSTLREMVILKFCSLKACPHNWYRIRKKDLLHYAYLGFVICFMKVRL
jgi:hypothetical protein